MSAILNALVALDKSLESLEQAAVTAERKAKQRPRTAQGQHDLFAAPPANGNNGFYAIDPAILASKLDVTIERVEKILREG